jgi:hypothetical protein
MSDGKDKHKREEKRRFAALSDLAKRSVGKVRSQGDLGIETPNAIRL